MAIAIKFNNIVARRAAVQAKLGGDLPQVLREWTFKPLVDANLLVWPAMMDSDTPESIAQVLQQAGLKYGLDATSDFAAVAPGFPDSYPDWLEVGHVNDVRACWLKGSEPGELIDWRQRAPDARD